MRCLMIINPVSGTQQFQRHINVLIGDLILKTPISTIDVHMTTPKNNAFTRTEKLHKNEYDLIITLGGDGTVNETIAGLIKSGANIPLALLPAGTVNDFATYLNLPRNFDDLIR